MDAIDVFALDVPDDDNDAKGGLGQASAEAVLKRIPVSTIQRNLNTFVQSMSGALKEVSSLGGDFGLREIVLNVEVTASGGVVLIGTAKVEGKGSISLRFSK